LLNDLFDYHLSLGSVHNIVHRAIVSARPFNASQNLADVAIGAHDEIFQAGWPVLVGIDVCSSYCYLLSVEEQRDADTWGVRLLELAERDFSPDATIADGGPALRSGQKQALPDVPCRSDVFHVLREVNTLVRRLENRAYEIMATVEDLNKRQANHQWRKGRKNLKFVQQLRFARVALSKAIALADDVATLVTWLQRDVLAVTGVTYAERCEMYDFIVDELFAREHDSAWIGPVRTTLENQEEDLLAFAEQLEEDVARLARQWQTREKTVRELLHTQTTLPMSSAKRWEEERQLRRELGSERYYGLSQDVKKLREQVVRSSSVVENLNSRLRNYFFLRKQVGRDYLSLPQFFVNHR
jgi:hypothetical protein